MNGVFILFVFIGIAVAVRLSAGSMDKDRIGGYIRARGGRLLSKEWVPFGRGWFGEKGSRIYRISYEDDDGSVHRAICKTSLFSGVYFTEDSIVRSASSSSARRATAPRRGANVFARAESEGGETADRLRRLDHLRAEQLISAEEHAEQRRRILDGL